MHRTILTLPFLLLSIPLGVACVAGGDPLGRWASVEQQVDGIDYRAESSLESIAPAELTMGVTVTNTGGQPLRLEYGACSLRLQAYRTPDRAGTPAWDSARWPNPDPVTGVYWICPDYLAVKDLGPGESHSPPEFSARAPVPQILGDSLPDGTYYLTARVLLNGFTGTALAGEVDLVAQQAPLPAERIVGDLHYRAETQVEAGSPLAFRSRVTVTNLGSAARTIPMARGIICPIQLTAYRDAESRAGAYQSRSPIWVAQGCPLDIPRATLAPGESRTFEGTYPMPPAYGGSQLPPTADRWYYLTLLWVEATTLGGNHRVFLAAGDEDLTPLP